MTFLDATAVSALVANAGVITGVVFFALGVGLVLFAILRRSPSISSDRAAGPPSPRQERDAQEPAQPVPTKDAGRVSATPRATSGSSPSGVTSVPAEADAPPTPEGPITVSLREVLDELVGVGDEETTFLDRETGEYVTLPDELRYALENDEPLEDPGTFGFEKLNALREKMQSKALIELPTKFEIKEFTVRERFVEGLPPGDRKEQMLAALHGQAAFRSFEGAVKRLGLLDDWELARDVELARVTLPWLDRHGLEFTRDVPGLDELERPLRKAG